MDENWTGVSSETDQVFNPAILFENAFPTRRFIFRRHI